ncbi:MAG: 6-pyruvoyl-tetrahydropterin synthase-related protein [Candidatus Eisenbacteria bacterium]
MRPSKSAGDSIWAGVWGAALAAVVLLLCGRPLLTGALPYDHDGQNSTIRFVYAREAAGQGSVSWRWLPGMARGYGYPLLNYYAPLATVCGGVLYGVTDSLGLAKGLLLFLSLGAGWVGVWVWVGARWRGPPAALAASLYVLAPYYLLNVFVRGAISETLALSIFPWVLWATDRAERSFRIDRLSLAAALWAGIVLAHNISAMVLGALLLARGVWMSMFARRFRPSGASLAVFSAGACLSAFFWIPALGELRAVQIHRLLDGYLNYRNHFVEWPQLFQRNWGWGYSRPGPSDGMSFQMGWVHGGLLVASALSWIVGTRRSRDAWQELLFWQAVAVGALILMLPLSAPFWDAVRPMQFIQFPWRLHGVLLLAVAGMIGPTLAVLSFRQSWTFALVAAAAALILYSPYCRARYVPKEEAARLTSIAYLQSSEKSMLTTTTSDNDFLPMAVVGFPDRPPPGPVGTPPGSEIRSSSRRGNQYRFVVRHDRPTRIHVSQFYFPGWKATVDGKAVAVHAAEGLGIVAVDVPGSGDSEICVRFGTTPLRAAATALSLCGLVGVVAPAITARWRARRKTPESADE